MTSQKLMLQIVCGVVVAGALAATAAAGPVTVTWGAQSEGGALATTAGQELPPGCLVRLGFFNTSLTHIQETAWDPSYLDTHFTEVARATTGGFDGTQLEVAGSFAQSIAADSTHLLPLLANRTVCVWVCNSATLATATETAVVTSPKWTLATGHVGSLIWDLAQVEEDGLIVGSFSPTQSPTLGGQMIQLASLNDMYDTSDFDADGAEALLEDAFGMNPDLWDAPLMPGMVTLDGVTPPVTGYRFRRPTGGSGIGGALYSTEAFNYTIQVSNDLVHWRVDLAACEVYDLTPDGDGYEWVTVRPSTTLALKPGFYRLRVERR